MRRKGINATSVMKKRYILQDQKLQYVHELALLRQSNGHDALDLFPMREHGHGGSRSGQLVEIEMDSRDVFIDVFSQIAQNASERIND